MVIRNKETYCNIFIVNVTLDEISPLSTHLHTSKSFGLIQGKEWPWSVFLNDLRVITEIIDSPSEFLVYLQRRIRANDFPQFTVFDELDYLMYFLSEGLFFEESDIQQMARLSPIGYTEDLDRYYSYLEGNVPDASKPSLNLPDKYKQFVYNLEKQASFGFTKVTTKLLSISGASANEFLKCLDHTLKLVKKDQKVHDFTLLFKDFGVTVFVEPKGNQIDWNKIDGYCKLKMYQSRFFQWIRLVIEETPKGHNYFLGSYEKTWEYDPQMEDQLSKFKQAKWVKIRSEKLKVGRNDLCPCGSGLKYKRCCWNSQSEF